MTDKEKQERRDNWSDFYNNKLNDEDRLQCDCHYYIKRNHKKLLFVYVPNDKKRTVFERGRATALGLCTGLPDTYIEQDHTNKKCYVEFKTPKGKLRKKQIERIDELRSRGKTVFIIDNLEEFKKVIFSFFY